MALSKTYSALADPTRQKIVELLKKHDYSAGDLGKHFKITAPSLSHHLTVLKNANLITSHRKGQEIIYSLNVSVFEEVASQIIKFFSK